MTIHTFIFRWKPGITDAEIAEAAASIRALQGEIPGLLAVHIGTNISPRSQGYAFGGAMHFPDRTALEAYNSHPAHQALLPRLMPLIDNAIEVDFDA